MCEREPGCKQGPSACMPGQGCRVVLYRFSRRSLHLAGRMTVDSAAKPQMNANMAKHRKRIRAPFRSCGEKVPVAKIGRAHV